MNSTKNKLYLFMIDDSIHEEDQEFYRKYAGAFFPGTEVLIMRQGEDVPG